MLNSGILSLEDLCIVPAKWVWCLYLDVCILNNDGNLFDSCLLSAVAALQNTRLPSIKVDNNTLEFNDSDASKSCLRLDCGVERSPLHLNWTLVPTTFAIFDNPNSPGDAICLVDPTGEEQQLCQGLLHIVVSLAPNSLPQIRSVIKTGGLTVDYALIKDCLKLATEPKRLSDVQTKLAK